MSKTRSRRGLLLALIATILLLASTSCEDATVGVGVYAPVYGGYGWGPGGTWGGSGYGGWGGAVYIGGPVYP